MAGTLSKLGLGLAAFMALPLISHAQNVKPESKDAKRKIEWGVSAGYEHMFTNLLENSSKAADNDFRNGRYTSTSPVPDWNGISVPSGFNLLKFEVSGMYPISNNSKIGLVAGYKTGNTSTSYNRTHAVNNIQTAITRDEKLDYTSPYIGITGKQSLGNRLEAMLKADIEFAKTKGNANWTIHRLDNGYTKWYNAQSEGKKTIPSVKLSLVGKLLKWLSLDVSFGKKFGKIENNGEGSVSSSTGNTVITYNYSPILDCNSFYASGMLTARW